MENELPKPIFTIESPLTDSLPILAPSPGIPDHWCSVAKINEEFARIFHSIHIEFRKSNGELAPGFNSRWQLLLTDSNTVADISVLFSGDADLGNDYIHVAQIVYYHIPEAIAINKSPIEKSDLNTPLTLRFDYDKFKQLTKKREKRHSKNRNRRPKITGILKSIINKALGIH